MEKLLNISGGATKISGLLASAKTLVERIGYKPTVITGVSSGSILALIIALNKYEQAEKVLSRLSLSTFMSQSPVNKDGKLTLTAYWRILTGKNSLGVQDIPGVLKEIITREDFHEYCDTRKNYPDVYILAVNARTGREVGWNVKYMTYERYLQCVAASCAIPVFTQPIEIELEQYYDGGLRNHAGGAWAIKNLKREFSKSVTIYSRPAEENFTATPEHLTNLIKVLSATISIFNVDVSLNDEAVEKLLCRERGIKHVPIHLPIMTKNLYDTDAKRLRELANLATQETVRQWSQHNF